MPILLEMEFSDGETKRLNIPAEIWRRNPEKVRKLIILDEEKELISVEVDPDWETADATVENNSYPRKIIPSRVEAYKNKRTGMTRRDLMEDSKAKLKTDADEEEEDEEHDQNERDAE